MNFKSFFSLIVFILFLAVSMDSVAQTGGRKREHRNQRAGGRGKLFSFKKSTGHADAFAKGGRKQGFISRIFRGNKSGGAWVYKKTNPGKTQNREQRQLFSRNRTKGKRYTDQVIAQQNRRRDATRVRGSQSFSKRKR
jgi:hypothetical protein